MTVKLFSDNYSRHAFCTTRFSVVCLTRQGRLICIIIRQNYTQYIPSILPTLYGKTTVLSFFHIMWVIYWVCSIGQVCGYGTVLMLFKVKKNNGKIGIILKFFEKIDLEKFRSRSRSNTYPLVSFDLEFQSLKKSYITIVL